MRVNTATSPQPGRKHRASTAWLVSLLLLARGTACLAGGGPFGIDHAWTYDDSGIWKRSNQQALEYGVIVAEVAGGLWEGGETRMGVTWWQSIDASVSSGIVSQVMKVAFSRVRPIDSGGDPNLWFKGHGNESFPSGEVTLVSSVITPFVLEYRHDQPWVYALEVLPVYDAIARMKVQAHWQTDVLAGFVLGTGAGYLIHSNANSPFILKVMPRGIYVGIAKKF
jgi:membrane-associated phospholipid phosphatase